MRAGPVYRPFQKALGTISRVLLPLVDTKKTTARTLPGPELLAERRRMPASKRTSLPRAEQTWLCFSFPRAYAFKGFPTTSYLLLRLLLLLLLPLLLQLPQPLQPSGTTATLLLLLLLLMSSLLLLLWLPLQLLLLLLLPPLLLLCSIPTPCPYHCYSCCVAATATAALQKSGDSQLQRQQWL